MILQPASELVLPDIEWLWPGYLAVGSIAILDGDPDLGKSLITLDLAARLSAGRAWPDGAPCRSAAPVLLLASEDPDNVVLPRLKAMDAFLRHVFIWPRLTDPGLPQLPSEIGRVDAVLADTGAKLMVIDPIMAFWDGSVDVNSDAHARNALRPLVKIAEQRRCVILMVRHLNKAERSQALYRGGASIAFIAASRLAWIVGRDPKNEERCVLAQTKNNYCPKQASLVYTLPKDGPRVEWHGTNTLTADDLAVRRPRLKRRRARDFLRMFLSDGPRVSGDVRSAAAKERITKNTLNRAKEELQIRHERICCKGVRMDFWLLPGQTVPPGLSDTPDADEALRRLDRQFGDR